MAATPKFAWRHTPDDLERIDTIADAMRRQGIRYPARSGALRWALEQAARNAVECTAADAG